MLSLKETIDALAQVAVKPGLFARTPALFWDDPYISQQMLAAHLDPSHDLASRRPEIIDQSVAWMNTTLDLQPGMRLLDLGCGPGCYCRRFAQAGLTVTGIDYSRRSIDYATADAQERNLSITYQYENYLNLAADAVFDVISLIWCDFGALTDSEQEQLLLRIYRALKPGGAFIFDVTTLAYLTGLTETRHWEAQPNGGFWRPDPYIEFRQVYRYPEADTNVSQYVILTADHALTPYNIWNRSFSPETIGKLLSEAGFCIDSIWGDLTGKPWDEKETFMGVIARQAVMSTR